jgi:hypothetical protein
VDEHITVVGYGLRVAPLGFGMGLFNAANNTVVLNAVAREQLGIASALLSLMRTLGQTTGVPLIASVFSLVALGYAGSDRHAALLTLSAEALVRGTHWAFLVGGCILLTGVAAGTREAFRVRTSVTHHS